MPTPIPTSPPHSSPTAHEPPTTVRSTTRRKTVPPIPTVREALAPYLDIVTLRRLAALDGSDLYAALRDSDAPVEVRALMESLAALLRPGPREQIKSPADVAALLMVEMGGLDQEQLRVLCLDTKNRIQTLALVYQGSLNSSLVRVGELFKEAIKRNSAAIVVCHNHPSGDPTPSPEDVLVTRQIVQAGALLDVECLDHLVIGAGRWVSMRERGLGFAK